MGNGLTPKQERFVEEYLVDLNATAAAIRAGYSRNRASEIGWQLLQKTTVLQAIQTAQADNSARTAITQEYVLANLKEIVERCMQRAPVTTARGGQVLDKNGNAVWKFDARGANKALELLGRHLGMFEDKQKLTLSGGVELSQVEAYDFSNVPRETLLEMVREAWREDKGGGKA